MNDACATLTGARIGDDLRAVLAGAAAVLDDAFASRRAGAAEEVPVADRFVRVACEPRRDADATVGLVVAVTDVTHDAKVRREAQFLASAGETLSQSLDYEVTLRHVAELAVMALADWCTVTAFDDEGRFRRLVCVHQDPAKASACARYLAAFPPEQHRAHGAIAAAKHGPLLQAEISEAALAAEAQSEEHLALLTELGCRSAILAPMISRGVAVGVISFMRGPHARRYGQSDLGLVMELARRAALAVDNARLYRDAQRAIRFRDEFLSLASHELRTPLTSLLLTVQGLVAASERGTLHDDRGGLDVRVARAARQVDRLNMLVTQLLDASRASDGRIELHREQVDLRDVVLEGIDRFRELAGATPILGERIDSVVGSWDRSRVDQVVANLLGNALKYGAGRPVTVTVEKDGGVARLKVRDEGIGIDESLHAKIFERFERARPRHAPSVAGFGLGLWIAREAVAAHGGTIRVQSRVGHGSTFIVELPLDGRVEDAPAHHT